MSVRVKDRGATKTVATLGKAARRASVSVGILGQGAAASHGGATVAEIATWMEFGTKTAPARPFIRGYVDNNDALLRRKLRGAMKLVAKGSHTIEQALGLMGLFVEEGVRDYIDAHVPPPNAPSTIKAKGHDKPLVGKTKQLYNSITSEVTSG